MTATADQEKQARFRLARQEYVPELALDNIHPDEANPNEGADEELAEAMDELGFHGAILVRKQDMTIIAGHTRVRAARELGATHLPAFLVDDPQEEARKRLVGDNRLNRLGSDNLEKLAALLGPMPDLRGTGWTEDEVARVVAELNKTPEEPGPPPPSLADRFLIPPFSVFDARAGYWQERKRQWLGLGIQSEQGRPANLLKFSKQANLVVSGQRPNRSKPSDSGNDPQFYYKKQLAERKAGRELSTEEFLADWYEGPDAYLEGTSVFDPVLCEVAYRWYSPEGGTVLDPFAGGSVRGIVASRLGRRYYGIDLSESQVAANDLQGEDILRETDPVPWWLVGDARNITESWPLAAVREEDTAAPGQFDFLFSCPPYFDLERYSDDPADLSNAKDYRAFLAAYRDIIGRACQRLADDRFACFVVGEIRDRQGWQRGLVADTICAFEDAGLRLHNEAVLVTSVGSLALRGARIFSGSRRLGRGHQSVLIFCKGDPQRAVQACGELEIPDPAELFGIVAEEGSQAEDEPVEEGNGGAEFRASAAPSEEAEPGPAWAKGYPLARLRQVAALWKRHDGDLPLGAFARVKENTVAQWAADGQLQVWASGGEPVAACALRPVTRPRPILDFRGEPIGKPAVDDWLVARVAGHMGVLAGELSKLGQPVWAELWQENPADRWLAEALGLHCAGLKIRASSELIGVWTNREPPGRMELGLDGWGLVRWQASFDAEEALAELEAAAVGWQQHYAVYNQHGSWQAAALRGYGADPAFIQKPAEMSRKWKAENPEKLEWQCEDTPLRAELPFISSVVELLPGRKERVRLMRLTPGGGELTRHSDITDPDAGTAPGKLLRIHLPVVTNDGVIFRSWMPYGGQQRANFGAGQAWYLDTRKPHTARNDGASDRIHIVADVESSPALLAMAGEAAAVEPPDDASYELPRLAEPQQPWSLR